MKKFHFRLETLLKVRRQKKEEAQRVLAEGRFHLNEAMQQFNHMKEEQVSLDRELATQKSTVMSIEDIVTYRDYLSSLEARMKDQEERIIRLKNHVEKLRKDLDKVRKEAETIERLREKQHLEWKQQSEKVERKVLDEIATSRYKHEGERG